MDINPKRHEHHEYRQAIRELCGQFDSKYWQDVEERNGYPDAFVKALTEAGWLAALIPEQYGGGGLNVTEASVILEEINRSGANSGACHAQMYIMGALLRHGSDEQKRRYLPGIASGELRLQSFAVTEPTTGTDTTKTRTTALRKGDRYIVNGQKVWISTAQVATRILLLARTTPAEEAHGTHGLTLFYTDFDRNTIEARVIDKMGRHAVDSNQVFIDGLRVPAADRIGEEGRGFEYILHGMNPERILIAAEAIGLGKAALRRATQYAKERVVFNRPIGKNQAIQHPLAECWMALEAANLMVFKAASLYDAGKPCGAEANAAKYLAGEAGFNTCTTAVMTHGGYGYAKEYHVERYLREVMISRIAPISPQLILCYIAEKVLGLPKSY
jgi:acyl-CoA dehydrogenase